MTDFDPIIGRYAHVEVGEDRHRMYFEEAGEGRPLVCLHTAGADSRQWHRLLCDAGITANWRAIAFDLPYHGRTMPPEGWWEKEYLLTTDEYAETVMAFVRALGLDRPVVLGCSMGGAIVLELARRYPDELGAVIGLSGANKIAGRFGDWSIRPDINAAISVAAWNAPGSWRHKAWSIPSGRCGGSTARADRASIAATPTSTVSIGICAAMKEN